MVNICHRKEQDGFDVSLADCYVIQCLSESSGAARNLFLLRHKWAP